METQAAGPLVERLLAELRQPLQTLTSLADLLDLKAGALDTTLHLHTGSFRDVVRHMDWLLSEAAFAANPLMPTLQPVDLRTLLRDRLSSLRREVRAPLVLEELGGESHVRGDAALLERFVVSAVRLADQLSEPGQRILLRVGALMAHGFPALHLDLEARVPHVYARDFATVEHGGTGPLAGFSIALENCRRILDAHFAVVEFADLETPVVRMRVLLPTLPAEPKGPLKPA